MTLAAVLLVTLCLVYSVGLRYGKTTKGRNYWRLGLLFAGLVVFGRILGAW